MSPSIRLFVLFSLFLRAVVGQSSAIDYCEALVDVLSICEEETPSFTFLAATEQASCLCGNQLGTLAWGPATFDSLASACAVQYATVDITVASDASVLEGFCTAYGGGVGGAQSAAATPASSSLEFAASVTTAATPQNSITGVPADTNTGFYSTASSTGGVLGSGSSPNTGVSVVTVVQGTSTPTPTPNGAPRYEREFLGLDLVMGALAVAGYLMA